MDSSTRKIFEKVNEELDNHNISLARIGELSNEISPFFSDSKFNEQPLEDIKFANSVSVKSFQKVLVFADKWQKKEIKISNEELKIMEDFSKKLTDYTKKLEYYHIKSRLPESEEKKLKDYVAAITKLIKEEKTRRQNSPNDNNDRNGPANNSDDTNEKITNLQNLISELEKKQKENPNSDNNQQDKQELERENSGLKGKLKKENDHKTIWMVICVSMVVIFFYPLILLTKNKKT